MPTVKDKTTGEVVAELPYDAQGKAKADLMVQASPNLEIDYAPGGASDAMVSSTTTYLEGGKIMPYNVTSVISENYQDEEDLHKESRVLAQQQISRSNIRKKKIAKKEEEERIANTYPTNKHRYYK